MFMKKKKISVVIKNFSFILRANYIKYEYR